MPVELAVHFLEDPHTLLVPIIHLSEQREIVSCVLVEDIVFYYHHLKFFHVKSSVHLDCAFVYQINDLRLFLKLLTAV